MKPKQEKIEELLTPEEIENSLADCLHDAIHEVNRKIAERWIFAFNKRKSVQVDNKVGKALAERLNAI